MLLTYQHGVFVLECRFEEKEIVKHAGFRWHPKNGCDRYDCAACEFQIMGKWWSDSIAAALRASRIEGIDITDAARNAIGIRPGSQKQGDADAYSTLCKFLSDRVLKRIYKTAVVELHPDVGGDEEKMKQVNCAWDEIRRKRGIR